MKKFLSVMLAFLTVLSVVPAAVFADAADEPVEIGTLDELKAFASDHTWSDGDNTNNKSAVLTSDIVITAEDNWTPFYFENATFDGQGHKITLTVDKAVGFMNEINNAVVKNLDIDYTAKNITDDSTIYFSALAAYMDNSSIENVNCKVDVDIDIKNSNSSYVGGLVSQVYGYSNISNIKDCTVSGVINVEITSSSNRSAYVGGLVGYNSKTTIIIENSISTANVTLIGDYLSCSGGLVGYVDGYIAVSNCAASGNVSTSAKNNLNAEVFSGGLVGYVEGDIDICNCAATGEVSTVFEASGTPESFNAYAGGLVGYAFDTDTSSIFNSYSLSVISINGNANLYAGGILGYDGDPYGIYNGTDIDNCYYYGNIGSGGSGTTKIGGIVGGAAASINTGKYTDCYSKISVDGAAYNGIISSVTDLVGALNSKVTDSNGYLKWYKIDSDNSILVFEEIITSQPTKNDLKVAATKNNGITPTYQWYKVDGAAETELAGETSDTLTGTYTEDVFCKITYVNTALGIIQTLTTNVVKYVAPGDGSYDVDNDIDINIDKPGNGNYTIDLPDNCEASSYQWMVWEPASETVVNADDGWEKEYMPSMPSMYKNGAFKTNGSGKKITATFEDLKAGDIIEVMVYDNSISYEVTDEDNNTVSRGQVDNGKTKIIPIIKAGDHKLTLEYSGGKQMSVNFAAGRWVNIEGATGASFVTDDSSLNGKTIRCAVGIAGETAVVISNPTNFFYDANKTEEESAVSAPTMAPLFFGTTVRVYDAENGTITPNGMPMIIGGMTKTFKFIPDDGYAVADVIVNGESYGAVEALTLDGFCGYVKLTAVFEKIEP